MDIHALQKPISQNWRNNSQFHKKKHLIIDPNFLQQLKPISQNMYVQIAKFQNIQKNNNKSRRNFHAGNNDIDFMRLENTQIYGTHLVSDYSFFNDTFAPKNQFQQVSSSQNNQYLKFYIDKREPQRKSLKIHTQSNEKQQKNDRDQYDFSDLNDLEQKYNYEIQNTPTQFKSDKQSYLNISPINTNNIIQKTEQKLSQPILLNTQKSNRTFHHGFDTFLTPVRKRLTQKLEEIFKVEKIKTQSPLFPQESEQIRYPRFNENESLQISKSVLRNSQEQIQIRPPINQFCSSSFNWDQLGNSFLEKELISKNNVFIPIAQHLNCSLPLKSPRQKNPNIYGFLKERVQENSTILEKCKNQSSLEKPKTQKNFLGFNLQNDIQGKYNQEFI